MPADDPITALSLHTSTLSLLQGFKSRAQSWDDFLVNLLECGLDRVDVQFAESLLADYRAGRIKANSRTPS